MAAVVVVGGGVGGMAAALRLRAQGHHVTLFERRAQLGGKLAQRTIDGYTFDIGPSLLTWPAVFRELFAVAGARLEDEVELVRLQQPFTYHFPDGSSLSIGDDANVNTSAVAQFAGARAAQQWDEFMLRAKRGWEVSERTFFAGAMESPRALLSRMRSFGDFAAIDPLISLARRSQRSFDDQRLQMWLNRYATYSGSDPWRTPASAACIPYLEQAYGSWHVVGGLARLAEAMNHLLERNGVRVVLDADVTAITQRDGVVTGVDVDGSDVAADVVVANTDAEHLYRELMPNSRRLRRVRSAGRSTSGFALLLGLHGTTPGLAHHNVWFSADQRQEFRQIQSVGVADEPTLYVCCSSVTDASQAPEGDENWFVLVNTAAGATTDWGTYGDRIIERLGVGDRVKVRDHMTPDDYAADYRAPAGAIYGSSSNGGRSAFLRASNRSPVRGLYLASGSAHPGGGLPLVATSARIVADLVQKDFS